MPSANVSEMNCHQQEERLAQLSIPPLAQASFVERIPKVWRKRVERTIVFCAVILVVIQLWIVRNSIIDGQFASEAPIKFVREMVPERSEYVAGEQIRFLYDRHVVFDPAKGPLLTVTVDSFENVETGELYPGATIGRVIDQPGPITRKAVRRLPVDMAEGTYVFKGWMHAETMRRSLPVAYRSRPFKVYANPNQPQPVSKIEDSIQ
jgi:hypothetical protein